MHIKHLASQPEYHQTKHMIEVENIITMIYIPFPAKSFSFLCCVYLLFRA